MKIALVLNFFLPDHVAGTEMYVLSLGKELIKCNHEVLILIPNYGKEDNDEYIYQQLRVIKYSEPSEVDRDLQMGMRKPDGLKNFISILKNELPEIVHFHELAGSNGITLRHVKAAKEVGCSTIMTFHLAKYTSTYDTLLMPDDVFNIKNGALNFYRGKGFSEMNVKLVYGLASILKKIKIDLTRYGKWGTALSVPNLVERKLANFWKLVEYSDRIVVISKWYKRLLEMHGVPENKMVFIEQGIPSLHAKNNIKSRRIVKETRLIFVGRISRFKGVKMLIRAVRNLDKKNVSLDIYGDSGEDKQYIEECKMMIFGDTKIIMKGRIPAGDSVSIMSQYDLLVLPSTITEMSPLVIREAFAAGIPVLASDNLGAAEQIKDGVNGWLFKMNNKSDLQHQISRLVNQPQLIDEAKKYLPSIRTFNGVADEYRNLYHSVLKSNERMKNKSYLLLSSEPWGKMLLSKMHFAKELSREGNAVYFVNPPRALSGEDSAIKEKLSSEENVTVIHLQEKKLRVFSREKFRPLYLKYEKEYIEHILALTGPVDEIWCFNPHFISDLELIEAHRRILFVYDLYKGKNLLTAASQADAVVSVAQNILDEFETVQKPKLLLHHGLAPEFAAIAEKKVLVDLCLKNRKIRIGYVGNLLRSSLDAEVFKNLIKTHQNIEFHFWGAVRTEDNNVVGIDTPHKTLQFVTFLKSQTNVFLRGIKPTRELAEEMQEMDVFLFMYSREKDINRASNSHKLMEYLSTGKPIIGTHVSRYAGTGLLAMDAPDSKDFLAFFDQQIARLKELSSAEEQRKRIDFALSNTYKKQVERVREFIADRKINIEKD